MPLSHISLPVSDLQASKDFYLAALKPLGYGIFMEIEQTVGMTIKYDGPDFWLHCCPMDKKLARTGIHVAFKANSRKTVDEFYTASLNAGAKDNGPPGERPQYVKGYYASYVIDLDGNNVECVYYQPWWLSMMQFAPKIIGAVFVGGVAFWGGSRGWSV